MKRSEWKKLGKIFCASGQSSWMITGGRAPVPLHLFDDRYRIYFASYDSLGRGRIFSLEIDLRKPNDIYQLTSNPVVDIGKHGFFDDNGVIPSDIVKTQNKIYLYTIGFSIKNRLMFDAASGLAISNDGGSTFCKLNGPVLDRSVDDPCFAASPTVLQENNGWRMWYVSCDKWLPQDDGKFRHLYNIKHKISSDGIYWEARSTTCINYANEHEYAISRPSVIREKNGLYRMWYSFREQQSISSYRIGYAESHDGLAWVRMDDNSGIDVSLEGWDSEMICYPRIFKHNKKMYMLYNGNGYGKTGFGLALLEGEE